MYEPLFKHRPPHRWTNGDLAAKVGADLGLPPDDEQRWILDTIYGEKAVDRPSSFEVAVVSPRQNIKTSTLGIAALADLFVFGVERHLWTAHHGDTLKGTFQDFQSWIRSNPEYESQVTFYEGHQDMSIVHTDSGNRIDFQSRTGKAGRGLTGVKRITLDEGLYLEPGHIGAVYPTMLTRPEAQVRVASSAGLLGSEQLRRIRDRGRAGKDGRLAFVEYGARVKPCERTSCAHEVGSPGCSLDDRNLWWQANCALWSGRITEESLEDQRNSMPPEEFMREFLSWWQDPQSEGGALDFGRWLSLADPNVERGTNVSFGYDVAEDRSAWIAVAWQRKDGRIQVEMVGDGALPAYRGPERMAEVARTWRGSVRCSRPLEADFTAVNFTVTTVPSSDFVAACGTFADALTAGAVAHADQAALNTAVKAARWRSAGTDGTRGFQLKDMPEVGPLAAAVRAYIGAHAGPSVYTERGLIVI